MHRSGSSGGFSLDIPLIMLIASFFRYAAVDFFFSVTLCKQLSANRVAESSTGPARDSTKACCCSPSSWLRCRSFCSRLGSTTDHRLRQREATDCLLVESSLARRVVCWTRCPTSRDRTTFGNGDRLSRRLPQRCHTKRRKSANVYRYWQFLGYMLLGLCIMQLVMAPIHSLYPLYSNLIGVIGLSVEATLPLPQMLANAQTKSCKGFRLSVLASWLIGDAMKMFWFFTATSEIPSTFKICGIFQATCDCFLGLQYFMYETPYMARLTQYVQVPGSEAGAYQMEQTNGSSDFGGLKHSSSRSITPTRRPVQFHDRATE